MAIVKGEEKVEESSKYSVYYTVTEIGDLFLKLPAFYPTIVTQWCNILTLLNCDNRSFWTKIVMPCQEAIDFEDINPRPLTM